MPPDLPALAIPTDVVRAPRTVGLRALEILGVRSGAVVEHCTGAERYLFWFIEAGASTEWDLSGTRAMPGSASGLVVPPAGVTQGPGPHWRICPGDGQWTTSVEALHAALADARSASLRGAGTPPCL